MSEECFHCGKVTSGQYTLVLEKYKILENKPLCEECLLDLQTTEWIEVRTNSCVDTA